MAEAQPDGSAASPTAESCRLIVFEHAHAVTQEHFPPKFVLRVSGTAPYRHVDVRLVPCAYIR